MKEKKKRLNIINCTRVSSNRAQSKQIRIPTTRLNAIKRKTLNSLRLK